MEETMEGNIKLLELQSFEISLASCSLSSSSAEVMRWKRNLSKEKKETYNIISVEIKPISSYHGNHLYTDCLVH